MQFGLGHGANFPVITVSFPQPHEVVLTHLVLLPGPYVRVTEVNVPWSFQIRNNNRPSL